MVISISGHNDATRYMDGLATTAFIKDANAASVQLVQRVERGEFVVSNLGPALRRLSHTCQLIGLLIDRRSRQREDDDTQRSSDVVPAPPSYQFLREHLTHYAMMHTACDLRGITFKLYFQPDTFARTSRPDIEQAYLLRRANNSPSRLAEIADARLRYRAAFSILPKPFPYSDLAGC
jgi:hypothetical protein